jgi:hypothetical protein
MPRAGATKVDLLDSDSEIARDRASRFVLGLAGIQPATNPSISVNLDIRAGYVIGVSEDPPSEAYRHEEFVICCSASVQIGRRIVRVFSSGWRYPRAG